MKDEDAEQKQKIRPSLPSACSDIDPNTEYTRSKERRRQGTAGREATTSNPQGRSSNGSGAPGAGSGSSRLGQPLLDK